MPEEEGGSSLLHVSISAEPLFTIGPLTVSRIIEAALLLLLGYSAIWFIRDAGRPEQISAADRGLPSQN